MGFCRWTALSGLGRPWNFVQGDKLGLLVKVQNLGKQHIKDEGKVEGRQTQGLIRNEQNFYLRDTSPLVHLDTRESPNQ